MGIGTTAPNETLSLYKLDRPYIQFISNTTGTTSSDGSFIGFANADGFLEIRNKEAQPIRLSTSDTERMRITSVGKVGIGTTSPASPLHIYQNGGDTSTGAGITIEQDGTGDAAVQYLLTGNRRWVAGVDNSDSDRFKFASSADVGTDTVVTINTHNAGGFVGIGTTSPQVILHASAAKTTYTDSALVFWGGTTNNNAHAGIVLASAGDALLGTVGSNYKIDGTTKSQTNANRSTGFITFANTTTASKTSSVNIAGWAKGTTTEISKHLSLIHI